MIESAGTCSPGSEAKSDQAPNVIVEGKCKSCDDEIDLQAQGISCFFCKTWYHGSGCSIAADINVCPNSQFAHVTNAINKTGGYGKRFGRFLFICNRCDIEHESSEIVTMNDRVDILDKKFSSFQSTVITQLNDLKNVMLTNSPAANPIVPQAAADAKLNPWDDTQRAARLRQVVTIDNKSSSGHELDRNLLEESCRDNGVRVERSYELSKSGKTAFVLNSKSDAEKLTHSVANKLPEHKTDQFSAKTPRITVVGLQKDYGKNELSDMLVRQNPGISTLFNDEDLTADDKLFKCVAIVPLHKDPNRYKAIMRVSNLIRSVIAKQQDRLYVGIQTCCKVYDNYFVLRCYNCQNFGHHSTSCNSDAHCAGSHETRACTVKNNSSAASCSNCKKANLSNFQHSSNDPTCPVLMEAQKKLRSSVPFYRSRGVGNP